MCRSSRDEADAGLTEGARRIAGDLIVVDKNLAAVAAVDAGGGADELALAFALDAGKADDLACMRDEIDVIEAAPAQTPDRQQRSADRCRLRWKDLPQRPARDQRDDFRRRDHVGRPAVDDLAVAHHRDAIGQLVDFVQPVRDIDDTDAITLELADEVEQLAYIGVLQRLRRLVEKEDFRIGGKRARDFDHMQLRQRQLADALADGHAQLVGRHPRQEAFGFLGPPGALSAGAASCRFSRTERSGASAGC